MRPVISDHRASIHTLARGLGWFSIALGAAELLAPGRIKHRTGAPGPKALLQAYGLREIATGAAILASERPLKMVWGRVAGDLLDIATLLPVLRRDNPHRAGGAAAMGFVLLATATDLAVALQGDGTGRGRRAATRLPPPRAAYVRYSPDVEQIALDEDETTDRIIEAMRKGGEIVKSRHGRALRTSHAKAHGLVRGELRIVEGLPPELRQGLFAEPCSYPVILRLAHVPGELLDDRRVFTPRGMAIKVLDMQGAKLPGHEGAATQDFVLDTRKVFNAPTARAFLAAITATEAAAPLPEGVKAAVSTLSRASNAALHVVGLDSANLDFYGHPFRHPLSEAYFSQVPFRYGDYIAKLAVIPDTPEMLALSRQPFEPQNENGLRTAVVDFMRRHPTEWRVAAQLCTSLGRMPIEDASVEWPEDESPYRIVGRLILPPQDAYSAARADYVEQDLLFCPAHSLEAHRPLGSVSRARLKAYEVLGNARRQDNGRPPAEPAEIVQMPS